MDLKAVMDELAAQVDTITGLRVHPSPPDTISPPAAVVTYPGVLTFDATYQRGMDRMDPSVVVLVGRVSNAAAHKLLSAYCAGDGPQSLKAVIEAGTYTAFDTVRVTEINFDMISIGAIEYLAATFTLDITGQGD